jgi:hypothetical protein
MEGNGNNPTVAVPSNVVKLEILYDQSTGAVTVNGPVDNGIFCYGLLECARQTIQNHIAAKVSGSRIVPANVLPMIRH